MIFWLKEYWLEMLVFVATMSVAFLITSSIMGTYNKRTDQIQEFNQLKVEAIIRGYAEYDKETLEWQWKEHIATSARKS